MDCRPAKPDQRSLSSKEVRRTGLLPASVSNKVQRGIQGPRTLDQRCSEKVPISPTIPVLSSVPVRRIGKPFRLPVQIPHVSQIVNDRIVLVRGLTVAHGLSDVYLRFITA